MRDKLQEGFEVFLPDHDRTFAAVREIAPEGRPEFVIYVENAGDFYVPFDAVEDVQEQKVILDRAKLDQRLLRAIAHAHDAEDPDI